MTTPDNNELGRWPDRDAMARSWVVRLKSGEATQSDVDTLLSWRAQNEENEGAFRQAVRLWEQLGPALAGGAALPPADRGLSRRWFLGGGAAMAAVAAVSLVPLAAPVPAGAREYRTGKGERRHVRLEPEVSAELNTDSRLLFWADAASPRVELSQGEARDLGDLRPRAPADRDGQRCRGPGPRRTLFDAVGRRPDARRLS